MMYSLTLSEEELNLVGNALAQLPYGQVVSLIVNIHRQVTEQTEKSEESD